MIKTSSSAESRTRATSRSTDSSRSAARPQQAHSETQARGISSRETEPRESSTVELAQTESLQTEPESAPSRPESSQAVTSQQAETADEVSGRTTTPPDPIVVRQSSNELYRAMRGGMGWGTDEEGIFGALEGKSSDEVAAIREQYQDHYGRDLDADLQAELSGADLRRATALMSADAGAAGADALRQAMRGLGTDEAAITSALEGRSQDELASIASEYEARHGRSLEEDLQTELSGHQRAQAQSLLAGDTTGADVAVLQGATQGLGTDEATVFARLEGRSAEERAAIADAYSEQTGRDLGTTLEREMSGNDLARAQAALEGDTVAVDTARLRQASERLGTDESEIFRVLEGTSEEDREALEAAYLGQTGRELSDMLSAEMGGNDLEQAGTLLQEGEISDAQRLRFATHRWGTDEEAVLHTLDGKSREEIAGIRSDFAAEYGQDLDRVLQRELAGRDRFDAELALEGRPESALEALEIANRRHDYERRIPNPIDLVTSHGRILDRNTDRANEYAQAAVADGEISAEESERLGQLTGFVSDDVETFREAKDSISEGAASVAGTAASVAAVVSTAGTASPLVAALGAAGAGAGARVGTKTLIQGPGYGLDAMATDAVLGAVEGGTAVIGAGAGTATGRLLVEGQARRALATAGVQADGRMVQLASRELLDRSVGTRVFAGSVSGAIEGTVGGAATGAAQSALQDGTWEDGLESGIARLAQGATVGAGLGAVTGGLTGAAAASESAFHLASEEGLLTSVSQGDNHTVRYGSYDEHVAVNKALEPNPHTFNVTFPEGRQREVALYGSLTDAERDNMQAAVQRFATLDSFEGVFSASEIHLVNRLGEMTDADGQVTGQIGGLGGANIDSVMLQRDHARTVAGQSTVHHEVGHNMDANRGWFTRENSTSVYNDSPFGTGESVSRYATTNASEDFAETHEDFIQNWENIVADPDHYFAGEIGAKRRWIAENIYRQSFQAARGE